MLKRKDAGRDEEGMAIYSLDRQDEHADRRARELLEPELRLFEHLLRREWHEARYAAAILARRRAPAARKAVKWAAESHPWKGVRDHAKAVLGE